MRFSTGIFSISVLAFSGVFVTGAAQAGFEWVAPKEDMSQHVELPTPKPGTPRISPQPLDGAGPGLDPLPPLSVNQENGTRATVYSPAPVLQADAPAALASAAPAVISDQAAMPAAEPRARLKTLHMGSAPRMEEPRTAGRMASPLSGSAQPQQLRMADKLIVPTDEETGVTAPAPGLPEAEGRVAINPAPLQPAPLLNAPAMSAPGMAVQASSAQPAPAVQAAQTQAPSGPSLEGFGSDIPLVMALQQIVPPEYTYSFGGGVNPGESVSWEGGKNWAQVLSEMLDTKGLRADIKGRSIQIQEGISAPRAAVDSNVNVATAMAQTAPAAGEPSEPHQTKPQQAAPALVPASSAKPVEKVEAVPPVYPPEVLGKTAQQAAPTGQRILGRISESGGLKIEDVKETIQIEGSPEAAKQARLSVTEHALGLAVQDGRVSNKASNNLPSVQTTSYSVTKTTRQVVKKTENPIPLRRASITDPGEESSHQPEAQALNLKPAKADVSSAKPLVAPAMEVAAAPQAVAPPKIMEQQSASAPKTMAADEQRKKLEDMARQQGIVLDSKNYNQEALGKIFNDQIAPASGESVERTPNNAAAKEIPAKALSQFSAPGPGSAPTPSLVPPEAQKTRAQAAPVHLQAQAQAQTKAETAQGSGKFWEASRGADLKAVLGEWSRQSGVTLVWKAGQSYKVGSNIMVHGGFNDAIKTLFAEGSKSGEFPVMRLNDGGGSEGSLIVEDKS